MRLIVCNTCTAPGEADFSGAVPVAPLGWQALLARHWEFECSKCWAAFLERVEAQRLEHVA